MNYDLKPITTVNCKAFFELLDNNRTRLKKYFPNTVKEIQSLQDSKHYLKESDLARKDNKQYLFGIYHGAKLIGYINVKNIDHENSKCELGYFIDALYERQGIMTCQIQLIIKFCFETLGLQKIFLRIGEENIGSRVLAEKNGFQKEGVLRKEFKMENGTFIDLEYYGILNPHYEI